MYKWMYLFLILSVSMNAASQCLNPKVLKGTLLTMESKDSYFDGKLLVCGELIKEIRTPSENWSTQFDTSSAVTIETDGVIAPGFINLHDHTAYNFLPLWKAPQMYENRYQWQRAGSYKTDVKDPYNLMSKRQFYDLTVEIAKWDEIKSITGGTTSIQGTPSRSSVNTWLARNVDVSNFGKDNVYSRVLTIHDTRFNSAELKAKGDRGEVDAFIIHIAEGVDVSSREEFYAFKQKGLLTNWSVIVHGTALGEDEFEAMGDKGTDLVWSPLSNLLLYGQTTRVDLALKHGVNIALATDWSPSGSKTLLDELKVAWEVNKIMEEQGNYQPFDTYTLAKMVTSTPAELLNWGDKVGRLKKDLLADIVVFSKPTFSTSTPELKESDPYAALIRATTKDVQLVLVGGEVVYGDPDVMTALKPGDHEVITIDGSVKKALDITDSGVSEGDVTFSQLKATLDNALLFDREYMFSRFKHVSNNGWSREQFDEWWEEEFAHVLPMTLDPIFVFDDPTFLNTVERITSITLKDKYYKKASSHMDPVLDFINSTSTTLAVLDVNVSLPKRTALAIIDYRSGNDGSLNTSDDRMINSREELDLIKYVGPVSIKKIENYSSGSNEAFDGEASTDRLLEFLNSPTTNFVYLDVTVGLRKNAAESLIKHRNGSDGMFGTDDDNLFDSLNEVDNVKHVGTAALRTLKDFLK